MSQIESNGAVNQWAVFGDGCYRACGQTMPQLPAGTYQCASDGFGSFYFARRNLRVDDLIDFPSSLPAQVFDEIERFWTLGDRFRKHGFLHRRGYLLYGKQGSGKTSMINQVIARTVERGNVAFFCEDTYSFVTCMQQFRAVEPDRPIVCIFEDIDRYVTGHSDSLLLQWLDGNCQVDKVINIATTNFPEKLDRRLIARPRRFDRTLQIDAPDSRLREAYFARKIPDLADSERQRWVELSGELPFAALAELIISVRCLGNDLEETATLLKELDSQQPSSDEFDEAHSELGTRELWDEEIPF